MNDYCNKFDNHLCKTRVTEKEKNNPYVMGGKQISNCGRMFYSKAFADESNFNFLYFNYPIKNTVLFDDMVYKKTNEEYAPYGMVTG